MGKLKLKNFERSKSMRISGIEEDFSLDERDRHLGCWDAPHDRIRAYEDFVLACVAAGKGAWDVLVGDDALTYTSRYDADMHVQDLRATLDERYWRE